MKRSQWIWALLLLTSASFAPAARAADPEALRQKLEKIKADREKARAAARATATPQPTAAPTPTPPPPPPPTATTTATSSAPKPTASAAASVAAPKPSAVPSAIAPTASVAPSASAVPASVALSDVEQLRKSRPDRKHREAQNLRERWGELVNNEQAKAELRLHAQRGAYLQRIRQLAESKNDSKLVESIDKLITVEERRSADAMNALRTAALPSGGKP
ncbi:MAG TPA: hypothetical protein VFQ35_15600 [Polyangiaceae bacterium]|nr:hypothetical protein [Polyangiaceae bacterium]